MHRSFAPLSCLLALAFAGCIQDADTILEPDPSADASPDGAPPALSPAVEVDPPMLAFERSGDIAELTIRSVGEGPLNIVGVLRNGHPGFAAVHDGRNVLGADGVDLSGEDGLAPGASLVITVEALAEPPAAASFIIRTDDPLRPEIVVPVGFPAAPCVMARPAEIDFGDVPLGQSLDRSTQVFNCGEQPVALESIALREGTDPQFELVAPPELGDIPPGETATVTVRYTARAPAPVFGSLGIEVAGESIGVPLTARGRDSACPVAAIIEPERQAELGEIVLLDGSASVDRDGPDGRPVRWTWTVVDQPEGAEATVVERYNDPEVPERGGPLDDPTTPLAAVHVDAIGTYVFELAVSDDTACVDQMRLVVEVCPCEDDGFAVVVDWATDPDAPIPGTGADLDLHLLHPNADSWFSRPYDCHYAEPIPDWGQIENPLDDPALDQDRVGLGPERIRLAIPERTEVLGAPYLVGVHYNGYRREGVQDVAPADGIEARVRVFIGGAVQADMRRVMHEDNLWDVAGIHWPSHEIDPRDRLYETRP